MNKILVILVAICLLCFSVALAADTGPAVYSSPSGKLDQQFIDFLNTQDCITHTHQFECERENPLGVGLDIVVWESSKAAPVIKALEIQEKYDFQNKENSVYGVLKVNLWNLVKRPTKVKQ